MFLADERVEADRGKTALQRGPIVFLRRAAGCGYEVAFLAASSRRAEIQGKMGAGTRGRCSDAYGDGTRISEKPAVGGASAAGSTEDLSSRSVTFRAIPYYAWAHREALQIAVFLARTPEAVRPISTLELTQIVVPDFVKDPENMKDGRVPTDVKDRNFPRMHWWPQLGASLWMEYHFPAVVNVSQVQIFWFDDRDYGACRVTE